MPKTYSDCEPTCGDGYYCDVCTNRIRKKAWDSLTPAQKNYDRMMLGRQAGIAGTAAFFGSPWDEGPEYPTCCSCHLGAPCTFCLDSIECESCGNIYNPEVDEECECGGPDDC